MWSTIPTNHETKIINPYNHWSNNMKKYLTLAAILGAIAIISVSYLAQADQKAADAGAAPAAAMAPAAATAPVADTYAMDSDMCNTMASAPTDSAAAPAADAKDAAFTKCMTGKGYTKEVLAQKAADAKAKTDVAAKDAAPKADAAKDAAPAAK
jgi:hypothetical protein